MHKNPEKVIFQNCSFCNLPGASHEGGGVLPDGEVMTGFFCNKICFDKWLKLYPVLRAWKLKRNNGMVQV
jgi:hypothetical protein